MPLRHSLIPFHPSETQTSTMPKSKLFQEVLQKFEEKLKSEESFDNDTVQKLLDTLTSDKKTKPNEVASIFQKEDVAV